MQQKKILMLGGTSSLIPLIQTAHSLGLYVITCDFLPNNIAHKYSDEYHNISVVNKDDILMLAKDKRIDGIISFACDAGILSASYVQNIMNLPSIGPYESVCILQNKGLFREFLKDHGFNVPLNWSYNSIEIALKNSYRYNYPIIVKPADSNGSKGVSKVDRSDQLHDALIKAFSFSRGGQIIIEEYIEALGYPSDSDCFSINGNLVFTSFSDQRFDKLSNNPFAPAGFSWPCTMNKKYQCQINTELQRLLSLLKMNTTIYNVETRVGSDGRAYLMEVSPRGGGNRLAEIIDFATGSPLIKNSILSAVGLTPISFTEHNYTENWAEIILHSNVEGTFKGLHISPKWSKFLFDKQLNISIGDKVSSFHSGSDSIGTLIFKLKTIDDVHSLFNTQNEWLSVDIN